jgi:hypothetical protein
VFASIRLEIELENSVVVEQSSVKRMGIQRHTAVEVEVEEELEVDL